MEATAVSVGKAVLDGALGYAKSVAAEEIALQLGIDGDVAFITDELEMMQSFLMTADEERDQNKVLTTWVKQVRELAYNVEDSLMDFGLHSELEKASWWCIPRNPCDRRRIAKEVKDLRAKVEEVSGRNQRYRLIKDATGSKPAAIGADQADIAGAAMFGIEDAWRPATEQEKPKLDLHRLITSEEVDLRVIAVWGTSGDLGKTSEIRKAYDDPKVNAKFGCRAWVRLMHPFNPKEFLGSLVWQFYENSSEEAGKAQEGTTLGANVLLKMETIGQSDLIHEFNAKVSSNSYLIVINGLSTIEEWDRIKTYFPDKKNQSRIIVSTQQAEIASLCTEQPYEVSELKQLSSDQVIYLFHKKVEPAIYSAKPISESSTVTTTGSSSTMFTTEIQEEGQPEGAIGGNAVSTSTIKRGPEHSKTMAALAEDLVGRTTEKSIVIDLIGDPDDSQGLKVISVWGMGGIGKTSLVRSVYRSQRLGGWKRAWATALRPFNSHVLIRNLALQLEILEIESQKRETESQQYPAGENGKGQKKNIGTMVFQEMTAELYKLLEKQKCLIVLDDLSSTEEWDSVKQYLANAKRIIVTTREKSVAKHCSKQDQNMYSLNGLEYDAALDLFQKKLFRDNTEKIDLRPDMMEQAELILKKCHGLPLAISTIGGFLATKPKTASEWRKLNDRIRAELGINPELKTIRTVLMRSYDGLPYHLKSSFLYLSIFPEDHRIKRKHLVRRWIAEGYSREMDRMTAMEVGDKHFDELLDRSMILPGEAVNHYTRKFDYCQLHDVIREIRVSKAREESLVFTLEEGCCLSGVQGAIRHLSISSSWKRDKDVMGSMLDLSHVRSLTVFGEWKSFFISNEMRFLRVLDLQEMLGLRDHHLGQIAELLHLRYLSLRGCRSILQLPDSLGNLRHLQTLDVRNTRIWSLPTTIIKLRKLEYISTGLTSHGGMIYDDEFFSFDLMKETLSCPNCCLLYTINLLCGFCVVRLQFGIADCRAHLRSVCCPSYLLHDCRCIRWMPIFWRPRHVEARLGRNGAHLPEGGPNRHDVFNIYRYHSSFRKGSHLVDGVKVPRGIRRLKALKALGVVSVARGNGKAILKELKELTQLQKLRVTGISNKNSKEFWSAIAGHSQLASLSVQPKEHEDDLDGGLGGDLSPPKCLESLKLYGKLVTATEWIHQLHRLSKLQLEWTRLNQDDIQALGMLPNLAVLRLRQLSFLERQQSFIRLRFQGTSFPKLMVLELYDRADLSLNAFTSVEFGEHAMPRLELLQADGRRWLEEISGLQFLASLKEIRLGDGISDGLKDKVRMQLEGNHQNQVKLKLA